ncbi:MAG: protein-export membrane protein SecF [Candidatus Magasanikbacteria bacterium RIFOXYA2_FULL_44_8]|uniref:Protein-export membrane protein SecF n=1 Tax=Candidatus Magasanikbacteria bacterium RIFOXYA2_FULL_44_8 TaxID=1798696 RepID=A0A1F6NKA4_9BACT|nr:MAG: protein-export membrane protein SecF [Candidatus Magasanikbacteria bacterium RIFOXYA2_FULL_44_8]
MTIPFIKYSKIWLFISGAVAVVSVVFLLMWGLKPGIDFTGGSLLEVTFEKNRPEHVLVQKTLEDLGQKNAVIQKTRDSSMIMRVGFLTEDQHQLVLRELRAKYAIDNTMREDRFETIGSAVSKQMRTRALWAIILVNLGIIIYIAYAFRVVSRPVASWKYGALAILALVHDVLLVLGVFSLLGHMYGTEVDIPFVVALLTVLGYSVNDTIVVYDRVRENLLRHSADNFSDTVNNGLNQTLMRSINTTMKTTLPLFALYFLGGSTINSFVLALIIGIISGAYSSIFIATPMLVLVEKWQHKKV